VGMWTLKIQGLISGWGKPCVDGLLFSSVEVRGWCFARAVKITGTSSRSP
jgi:hypothetical protein